MKIIEYKYNQNSQTLTVKWQEEQSEFTEKTAQLPLPSFLEALENLKDVAIEVSNFRDDTEVGILGIKFDAKKNNSFKLTLEVYAEEGATWQMTTKKIYLSQITEVDQEAVQNFIHECARYINGERAN